MCGIFGAVIAAKSNLNEIKINNISKHLANYSELRGRDSSGFAFIDHSGKEIKVIKSNQRVTNLNRTKSYKNLYSSSLESYSKGNPLSFFGHSRLVTNGTHLNQSNNQPIIKDKLVSIHNGIIVNNNKLWETYKNLEQKYEIDTEIFNSLVFHYKNKGNTFIDSFRSAVSKIEGTASLALYSQEENFLTLYSNNKSLHFLKNDKGYLLFASEKYTLEKLDEDFLQSDCQIITASKDEIITVNLESSDVSIFSLDGNDCEHQDSKNNYKIHVESVPSPDKDISLIFEIESQSSVDKRLLNCNTEKINNLIRCNKCILPETFPFITFNSEGTCNYCLSHQKESNTKSIDDLIIKLEKYKSTDDSSDCIIPFSGGRDSTFTLHYAKEVLGLNPIAFTYDWAMVTDLARRNIARVCGKLGVENIIVAADIHKKRNYIKKNVLAWLRRPSLGMVPLFMAGDKHFFRFTQLIKKRTNLKLNIWGINRLENTDFKSGFGGVRPNFEKRDIYSLSTIQKLSLAKFLGINIIKTPEYINDSIIDNLSGHISRIIHPRKDFFSFFDYYPWNEKEINDLIINKYDWETAVDTVSTWRIGDGTASFYNYIYYRVAGFSEIDTFRSNQIREGLITRDKALELSIEENLPRYENIAWYLKAINVPYKLAIMRVNNIPTIY